MSATVSTRWSSLSIFMAPGRFDEAGIMPAKNGLSIHCMRHAWALVRLGDRIGDAPQVELGLGKDTSFVLRHLDMCQIIAHDGPAPIFLDLQYHLQERVLRSRFHAPD